jgi:hypothetical protein
MADLDAEIAATRAEMSQVHSGSKREGELQQQLTALYQQKFPEEGAPGLTPRPDGYQPMPDALTPEDVTLAQTNVRSERLAQIEGELEMFLLPTARRTALEQERDAILKADAEALDSYAPEPGPTPETVMFAEGTEEPVKNAFCGMCFEHGIPASEAQSVLDAMKTARWLTPEQFRAEMTAEWGDSYAALAAAADRALEQLPFVLQDEVKRYEAGDRYFSPEVARWLIKFTERQRGGPR